jgi:membrane fusion protein (multidrug efflux system)
MESTGMRRVWLGGALAGTVALAGCGTAAADSTEAGASFGRVINVSVATLVPERFVEDIRLTAVAVANQDVQVSAEESGVIRTLYVERGQAVGEGDPIAKIDDSVLAAQVAQARAAAEFAAQTWERRRRLWEDDQVGSEIAYLEAKFAAEQSAASLASLEARLARTLIRAPFAGILDDRFVDVGAMVSPGQAVARLVDLEPIKVVAGVPERYAPDIRVGDQVMLDFEVLEGDATTTSIRYVSATVDPRNRTFAIEVQLPNPGRVIKPQMIAAMGVTRRAVDDAIVVPQDALVRTEDGYVAFVAVERDGTPRAEARSVVLGPRRRNLVVIESGLEAGDRLIVVGQKSVENGDHIRIVGGA